MKNNVVELLNTPRILFLAKGLFLFAFCALIAFSMPSSAEIEPARRIENVSARSVAEQVQRLKHARVILADYPLIKKDFPELRDLSNDRIDQWLLDHAAFVSLPQIASAATSTKIEVTEQRIEAFRPPNYNRALVFSAGSGMLDSKGNGSLNPRAGGHSDGLATLGEVIREYLYGKLVQKIFDHEQSGLKTVANYAVLDFGFRVIHGDGSSSQAGAVLRQAHERSSGYMSMLPLGIILRVEKILRRYGITSTGTKRDLAYDLLNVQGTSSGAVIDFGGFLTLKKFTRAVREIGPFGNIQGPLRLVPGTDGSNGEVAIDPAVRVPYELWGSSATGVDDSKTDNPFVWSHELAEALAQGRATRADAEQHVRNLLEPIDARFAAAAPHFKPMGPEPQRLNCHALFAGH